MSNDILEFIRLLNQKKVEYLVVGGWAVAFHGRPRYTKDIDIFLNLTEENSLKILEVLHDFGFGELDITQRDLLTPGQIIQLGFEPNRIDLLTSIPETIFEEAYKNRVIVTLKNTEIKFIGLDALIKNKQAAARDQDLVDVKFLLKARGKK